MIVLDFKARTSKHQASVMDEFTQTHICQWVCHLVRGENTAINILRRRLSSKVHVGTYVLDTINASVVLTFAALNSGSV